MPAAETSTSFSNRPGSWTAVSAAMKPPIELPTIVGALHPEGIAEVEDEPAEGLDRELPVRHRAVAEPGQVEGDDAVFAREVGDVLEPVRP